LQHFAASARRVLGLSGEVQILITSNRRLRELNRRFRNNNKATDVLSFPAPVTGGNAKRANRNHTHEGDIAISAEIAAHQAEMRGHSLAHEIKVLILHGMLHLAGYDHETDDGTMARKEEELRERLGLREGLIRRAADTTRSTQHRSKLHLSASRTRRT
jgi:probable rRNA maturation factor